jgi:hypothetical protein
MAMYNDKVVGAVKVNGQVLRENGDIVTLPFGCEYSILVKNLNSVRTRIKVDIDGEDAVGFVIIGPNSSVDLERFIRNGNLDAGNRFKFIERTPEVESHRGIGSDDGLIRIEAWRERVYVPPPRASVSPRYPTSPLSYRPMGPTHGVLRGGSARRSSLGPTGTRTLSDVGITVPGSESRQRFVLTGDFSLEYPSTVIILRLRGEVNGQPVEAPITVDQKPVCSTCGKTNKAGNQFCGLCGTALVLI